MQIKNVISFIFFFQSVISFPRRNRNGHGVEDFSRNRNVSGTFTDDVSTSTVSFSTVSSSTVPLPTVSIDSKVSSSIVSSSIVSPTNSCTC